MAKKIMGNNNNQQYDDNNNKAVKMYINCSMKFERIF